MNRTDFQALAIERSEDARALLDSGRYACAYYISGYVIECGLKAVIARRTREHDFPPKDAARYYTHDLTKLMDIAGLASVFEEEAIKDAVFRANWAVFRANWTIVKDWTEEARYERRGQRQAKEMLAAVGDPENGVLEWLKRNW